MLNSPLTGDVRTILVLNKPRYIGDTVVAVPLFRGLRRAFQDARISILVGPATAAVLQGCPYVDEMVIYDPYGNDRGPQAYLRLVRSLRKNGAPDLCLVINASVGAALLAVLCGAKMRVGWPTEGRRRLLTHPVPHDPQQPEIDAYLDILRVVAPDMSEEPYDGQTELWVTDEERARGAAYLQEHGVGPGDTVVALHPGAHDPEVREWGIERYAAVGDRLIEELKARIILLGSAEERERAECVEKAMKQKPILLAGETGLRQTMAVVSNCHLWIGNDGGMLHTAVALATPTIGIFGPTKARPWGYNAPKHRTMVVYPEVPATDPATIRRCLDAITPELVFETAEELLAAGYAAGNVISDIGRHSGLPL